MLKENVKIIVTRSDDNQRFERIETIETDGSFDAVQAAISRIVNRDFPIGTVLTSSWQYI